MYLLCVQVHMVSTAQTPHQGHPCAGGATHIGSYPHIHTNTHIHISEHKHLDLHGIYSYGHIVYVKYSAQILSVQLDGFDNLHP